MKIRQHFKNLSFGLISCFCLLKGANIIFSLNGGLSREFMNAMGVKKGCLLSSILFGERVDQLEGIHPSSLRDSAL